MHILTQAIEPTVVVGSYAVAAAAVVHVATRAGRDVTPARVGAGAVLAGGVLAAHVVEFPLPGGTGHVLAAGLAVALLGPRLAALLVTALLVVQAAILGDGSFAALGLNVVNMALIAVGAAWLAHRAVTHANTSMAAGRRRVVAACVAAWAGLAAGQLAVAAESLLGLAPAPADLVNTIAGHGIIVTIEVVVTAAIVAAMAVARRRSRRQRRALVTAS